MSGNGGIDRSDDELLERLRQTAAQVDAPPTHLLDGAKAAFGLRRVDEELAELSADLQLELVRSSATAATLAFVAGDASIEIDVEPGRIVGALVPGEYSALAVESADGTQAVTETDRAGRFEVSVPPGAIRLRVTLDGVPTVTDWFIP